MVKPFFSKKTKKALFFKLLLRSAPIALLVTPLFAQASVFSFVTSLFQQGASVANAQVVSLNSQSVPVLTPALNLDPNPAKGGGDISFVDNTALLPETGPSGTLADINEWPQSSQVSVYTVRDGDSLSGIAKMFHVSTNTIIWSNDIKNGVIHPGDTLVILPITGIKHTVAKGETLGSLAKKFKADANEIAQYNGLDSNVALAEGVSIIIPNGEVTLPPAPTSHSSTISKIAKGTKTEPYLGGSGPAIPGFFIWPVAGGVITQGLHGWNAVDIGAPKGTGVFAAADGVVIVAKGGGGWNGGYGNYVVVQHSNGTQTLYGHASQLLVAAGDSVVQGQTIALMGATGLATGSHLHFEVRGAQNPFAN